MVGTMLANPTLFAAFSTLFAAFLVVIVLLFNEMAEMIEVDYQHTVTTAVAKAILDNRRKKRALHRNGKRTLHDSDEPRKRVRKQYDRDRARLCMLIVVIYLSRLSLLVLVVALMPPFVLICSAISIGAPVDTIETTLCVDSFIVVALLTPFD